MRSDSRLSRMLHVLLHMARQEAPFTSEQLARMLDTNPVVVRRTMAGLKKAGYVQSEKGHGGGWKLSCDLAKVSLLDIHEAVGGPRIFAIGNTTDNPECGVEKVVNAALDDALAQAQALLVKRLAAVKLGDLAEEFDGLCKAQPAHARGQQHGH
ncbi:Rrf2 family transcriptional regulator [Comamonas endophytica]|uniref:Rrf2 family transcriptional regulator n=1 Tax=Comamonas endophytica TaxID=2949090 RepID=A0ABY6GG24_9BURK|nr:MULTISPECIES: Rrf2 family transcriptional regulator [unclassified Acidovorax]MCD2513364.1 Rrf2 family transcriptional regulator [Acidovorax sp. D4N7]UYG53853.1 Rrf2 family transcriptional regulator [Acidovorax sp. 5MLIR]